MGVSTDLWQPPHIVTEANPSRQHARTAFERRIEQSVLGKLCAVERETRWHEKSFLTDETTGNKAAGVEITSDRVR